VKKWVTGDLHVHSDCCADGTVSVENVVKASQPYCDFLAISGHARRSENWGVRQYQEILQARKKFPEMPIFHTGELEFPIERHTMVLTSPENNEFELQKTLVKKFDRLQGVVGIGKAVEELFYIEKNWGRDCFMVFNHPSSPDVSFEDFDALAASDIFKVIACYDRGERRAGQTWDIGGEWDQLLSKGHKIFVRFGSDFHQHFSDGGSDYYPGEFVQDHLLVENNSYGDIIKAYRSGNYFCTVDNLISSPSFALETDTGGQGQDAEKGLLRLSFKVNAPIEQIEIICDGKTVFSFTDITKDFVFEERVDKATYFRVRGIGQAQNRKYTAGEFQPAFLLNPIFWE
jgi:hypothetical protein